MSRAATISRIIDGYHPDAGVLVLDCRGGKRRKVAYRARAKDADDAIMDAVVLLNAPRVTDPRRNEVTPGE